LDEERLLPGQDWSLEIEKNLRHCEAIILFLSQKSVQKEGYVQREYRRAMAYQEEKPEGTVFVIPVRLDNCEMPFFIRQLQWIDFPQGYDRLVMALEQRKRSLAEKNILEINKGQTNKSTKTSTSQRPTFEIEGGIHAGRDIIMGDQRNYVMEVTVPTLYQSLTELRTRIAVLANQPELSDKQLSAIKSVENKLSEATVEIQKTEPNGNLVITSLMNAKKKMKLISDIIQSARALESTINSVTQMATKLFDH
jgi:hypothetical protein